MKSARCRSCFNPNFSRLDTRSFMRVGGEEIIKVNARLMVATNRDLEAQVKAGMFRNDLFYRLNVFPILTPPLRERVADIPLLIEDIMDKLVNEMQIKVRAEIEPSALQALVRYQWPGNIRELRNVLERALILSQGGPIRTVSLQIDQSQIGDWRWSTSFPPETSFNVMLANLKRALISEALARSNGKRVGAAVMLGMTRDTLKKQMKTLGMQSSR